MIFKYELGFVAFTWPNLCLLDLSLLIFIVLVGRNFVSDIKLKPKNLKFKNLKTLKAFLNKFFPALHQTHGEFDACENRWLRRITWIAYKDRITNETIRQRTQQVPLSNRIRLMRLKWLDMCYG